MSAKKWQKRTLWDVFADYLWNGTGRWHSPAPKNDLRKNENYRRLWTEYEKGCKEEKEELQ